MKKITIIAVALIAVSFASCKKAKTCTCTTTTTHTNSFYTTNVGAPEVKSYDKISSSEANAVCPKSTVQTTDNGQSGTLNDKSTSTTACTLS